MRKESKFEKEINRIKNVKTEDLEINYPKLNKDDEKICNEDKETVSDEFKNLFFSDFLQLLKIIFYHTYAERPEFFEREFDQYEENMWVFMENETNYIYLVLKMYFKDFMNIIFTKENDDDNDDEFIDCLFDEFFDKYYEEVFDEYCNKCLMEITEKEYIDISTPFLCCTPFIKTLEPYMVKFLREEGFEGLENFKYLF